MDLENNLEVDKNWALPGDYNLPLQQLDVQSYNNTYYHKSFINLNKLVKPLNASRRIHTDNSSVSNDTFYEASPILQQPTPAEADTAETAETPSEPANPTKNDALYYPTLVEMPYSPVVDVNAKPHMAAPLTNNHALDLGLVADPKVNLQLAGPLCNVPDMATADDETRLLHILEYEMELQTPSSSTIWSVLSDFIHFFFKPDYHTLYPWAKFTMAEPQPQISQYVDEIDLDDIFLSIYKLT